MLRSLHTHIIISLTTQKVCRTLLLSQTSSIFKRDPFFSLPSLSMSAFSGTHRLKTHVRQNLQGNGLTDVFSVKLPNVCTGQKSPIWAASLHESQYHFLLYRSLSWQHNGAVWGQLSSELEALLLFCDAALAWSNSGKGKEKKITPARMNSLTPMWGN